MRSHWRRWQRYAHRAVLQHLRTPAAPLQARQSPAGDGGLSTVAPRMPLLSYLYGRIVAAKRSRALAQAQRIAPTTIPVISVGNFTFGATGKTPCVLFLTEMILQHTASLTGAQWELSKRVPLLLTRGYGDDEWRMFASRFPSCKLAVGADRVALGKEAVARYGASLSCVVLEDGLQQWKIRKDLEIVMVDALAPFGNGKLLPHGSLRELPEDALARADVVLLHHANLVRDKSRVNQLVSTINALTPRDRKAVIGTSEMAVVALPSLSKYETTTPSHYCDDADVDWQAFQGQSALIFCGVGNPESVELVVKAMGCWTSVEIESFPDHHAFSHADLHDIRQRIVASGRRDVVLITTEKDYARSGPLIQSVLSSHAVHVLVAAFRLQAEGEKVANRIKTLLLPQ